ncbi:MAG: hypothetical protein H7Y03_02395 [Chitinophagaceae bacterium]|nr:hypothetical protein [Chitinophagaceae bacterium]
MITMLQKEFETRSEQIKKKIETLSTALFFTENSSVLQLPTHVINGAEVDEEEHIWFVIPRPEQHLAAFDKELPAKLDFFKKGSSFYIKIKGIASMIHDTSEVANVEGISSAMAERMRDGRYVAVRVKIQRLDYFETGTTLESELIKGGKSLLFDWL